jgi:L-ascorbate metabolism protein UlaG (beta-lactamase superfamily)
MSEHGSPDAEALRAWEEAPLPLPPGLEIEWLGVSGYRLTYEGISLFVDPYVSRVPLRALVLRRRALPNPELISRYITPPGEVAGILVGHTHFDHAVDAPAIARRFGVRAYGSASLAQLMRLHGLADLAVQVKPHRRYEIGPFVVRFVPSRHSKLLLGLKVPMAGELTCEHLDGLAPTAYKCGDVWGIRIEVAGVSLYHQGSADLDDEELARENRSTSSWPGWPAEASPLATGSESFPGSTLASSCPPITTTSSLRWAARRSSSRRQARRAPRRDRRRLAGRPPRGPAANRQARALATRAVPEVGFEPTRPEGHGILSAASLPFLHSGAAPNDSPARRR